MSRKEIKSVYLDTTIPSHYYDERQEIQAFVLTTKNWWDNERQYFKLFSSLFTIAELEQGNFPSKEHVISLLQNVEILEPNKEINDIANIYMKEYVMPKGAAGDAFHLACASFYKIDYLLTWNCSHLANANKDQHIRITNGKMGLFTPKIITPLELFREME